MVPYNPRSRRRTSLLTSYQSSSGISLIEMMVAITIVGILTGMALPDLSQLLSRNRVDATANELYTSLSSARSYAINQNALVQVCPKAPDKPESCQQKRDYNTNWSHGWLIFVDLNRNNDLDDGDTVLQSINKSKQTTIVFNQRGRLRFFPDGSARSAGFYLCDANKKHFNHLLLLHTGRARTKQILNERQRAICARTAAT